jgi:hypothetical protein
MPTCAKSLRRSQDLTTNLTSSTIGRIGMNVEIEQSGIEPFYHRRVERVASRLDRFHVERRNNRCDDANRRGTMNVRKELLGRQASVRQADAKGIILQGRHRIAHGRCLGAVKVLVLSIVEDGK